MVKQYTGKTAKEFIQARIILEAKRLLFHSDLSIEEIGFDLGFEGKKIVVNSFFSANTGFVGNVSKTAPPTGKTLYDNLNLNDALFVIFENGIPFDTLQSLGNGRYEGVKYPSHDHQHYISVSKSGLETATSSLQKLPLGFEIETVNLRKNNITSLNKNFPTLDFDLLIKYTVMI